VTVSNAQVRKLMEELGKTGQIGKAALRAAMDRKTARKYRDAGALPSELRKPRRYRTRSDPFDEDWAYIREGLIKAPELDAKMLFDHLCERSPDRYQEGQLRTLQRRIKRWRSLEGPPKEIFFPQQHRPGEALQTDFTWATKLEITIAGEPFPHMLCNSVLPYSNWQAVTVCRSESFLALKKGLQCALFRLGRRPEFHQIDNSTSATHTERGEDGRFGNPEEAEALRKFNDNYLRLVRHFGLEPRTTGVGKKEQNGDVESLNGSLKRRLEQHLLLRGDRDFASLEEYETWLDGVVEKANRLRRKRLGEELAVMKEVKVRRLPEFNTERVRVGQGSTIRVQKNTYSVPSRLIGTQVEVRVYEERIEVRSAGQLQLVCERLLGSKQAKIDYRHLIHSLIQKPGALERYRHREALFPSLIFRQAHDALHEELKSWSADLQYLRILGLAAESFESEIELALKLILEEGRAPRFEEVKGLVRLDEHEVPKQAIPEVNLAAYDRLLTELGEVA